MTERNGGWGYGGKRSDAHRREKERDRRRHPIKKRDYSSEISDSSPVRRTRRCCRTRHRPAQGSSHLDRRETRNALTYRDQARVRSRSRVRRHWPIHAVDCRRPQIREYSVSDCSGESADEDAEVTSSEPSKSEDSSVSGSYETELSTANVSEVKAPVSKVNPVPPKREDIVHFDWTPGLHLNGRYRVSKLLGDGTFGRVLLASDDKDRELAVKVIRSVDKYIRNAKREAEILKDICDVDPKKSVGCVRMFDTFWHAALDGGNYFCLAFEVLGISLYDLLKQNRFRGMWMQDIQSIARQCLEALAFLHDSMGLTHTDLKLENILFQSTSPLVSSEFPREEAYLRAHKSQEGKPQPRYLRPASSTIKLIDFGNATYELEHHSSIINTRQYRAPEVILAAGWNERSDLWSVGCITMELYSGELLFRTHESLEHLALMERAVEPFPPVLLENAGSARRAQLLRRIEGGENAFLRLHWPEGASSEKSEKHVTQQKQLHELVEEGHRSLADFVASLLILEPARRPSAAAALVHPFLFEHVTD